MKYSFFIAIILIVVFGQYSFAQEPEYEMLFSRKTNKNNRNLRMYGTLTAFHSPINLNGNWIGSPNLAAEIGLSYKRKFGFGITAQSVGNYVGLIKSKPLVVSAGVIMGETSVLIQQFGVALTYTHNPGNKFHSYARLFASDLVYSPFQIPSDFFTGFNINPNIGLEYNLLPYLTIRSDIGYRFTTIKEPTLILKKHELSGFIGSISLKIGNIR